MSTYQPKYTPPITEATDQAYADQAAFRVRELNTVLPDRKFWLTLFFIFIAPWYLIIDYLLTPLEWVLPSAAKSLKSKLLRKYLRHYFDYRGITHYRTLPFPDLKEHPTVIITPRFHELSSLYIYAAFDQPIIVPVTPALQKFTFHPKLPIPFLRSAIKAISYPESIHNANLNNINTLINKGYPILVHINAGYVDPMTQTRLFSFKELFPILDHKTIRTYYLDQDNMERYPFASKGHPIMLRLHIRSKPQLFQFVDTTKTPTEITEEKWQRITAFFRHKICERV